MRRALFLLPLAVALVALSGCRQDMTVQPKLKTYSTAAAFDGDAEARPLPYGTVPRDAAERFEAITKPPKVDAALLERGRERFEIYCTPCHGKAGLGDGIIVQRGFPKPPSYLEPRLLAADPSHFFDVITNGWGVMYPYRARVEPRDRWAIVAYIRALQVAGTGLKSADASGAAPATAGNGGAGR